MACFIGKNDFSAVFEGYPMNRTCGTGLVFLCSTFHWQHRKGHYSVRPFSSPSRG